ncbi:hypothetical protein HYV74_01485 [Candidatus Uhrbacteria bacterium]|nr:hypothetical protein [Candidatus Uhrbacteria bacterium]
MVNVHVRSLEILPTEEEHAAMQAFREICGGPDTPETLLLLAESAQLLQKPFYRVTQNAEGLRAAAARSILERMAHNRGVGLGALIQSA